MQRNQRVGRDRRGIGMVLLLGLAVGVAGCGGGEESEPGIARTPKQAASQLESAFASAPPAFRGAADAAAQALRDGKYVEAVESLQTIKASHDVTVNQGLAVHGSLVQLETQLIQAMEAGDPNARAAYDRLRAMKGK